MQVFASSLVVVFLLEHYGIHRSWDGVGVRRYHSLCHKAYRKYHQRGRCFPSRSDRCGEQTFGSYSLSQLLICSFSWIISHPATLPEPLVGLERPHNIFIAVVFPLRSSEKSKDLTLSFTWNEIWSTAIKEPNAFVSSSTSIAQSGSCIVVNIHNHSSLDISKKASSSSGWIS